MLLILCWLCIGSVPQYVQCCTLLITFSLEFSLSHKLPLLHSFSFHPSPPKALWELSSANFRLSQWPGLTTPHLSTPHRLTRPLMPIYCTWQSLWSRRTSGVEYAYWKQGPALAQTSVAEHKRWKATSSPPPFFLLSSPQTTQTLAKTLEGLDSVNKNSREVLGDVLELMMWLWWECLHSSCWKVSSLKVWLRAHVCVCEGTFWQTLTFDKASTSKSDKFNKKNNFTLIRYGRFILVTLPQGLFRLAFRRSNKRKEKCM